MTWHGNIIRYDLAFYRTCICHEIFQKKSLAYMELFNISIAEIYKIKLYIMEYILKTLSEICMQNERFQGQSTGYGNGCFSALNRVKHLYSENGHLKFHGNSIE